VLALMNCVSLSPISTACYPGILKHRCSSLDAHVGAAADFKAITRAPSKSHLRNSYLSELLKNKKEFHYLGSVHGSVCK